MYRGEDTPYFDLSGGLVTNKPLSNLADNESPNLRNVFITTGKGIQKINGNTVFNSSAMASGAAVTGLFYYKQSGGTEYINAIAGTKVFSSPLNGTMTDITGAVSITSSQNNLWTACQMNDLAIFAGGAPDAPFKWSGTGNAAILGGSPPTGNFVFSHNNRLFIGGISGNLSRIQWSALGDPESWSAAGSGSQDVQKNDGDTLIGFAKIDTDNVLLFKENSIHRLVTRTSPFPVFPLFSGVGAVGKRAIVVNNGTVYFITSQATMKIISGDTILDETDIPSIGNIDDIWGGLNKSRLKYITGIYYNGVGFDHIVWFVSSASSSTNDLALIWDIRNKCWLRNTSGYKANSAALTQAGAFYTGHYDGKIYLQDVEATYTQASETSPGAIDAYWASNWKNIGSLSASFHPFKISVAFPSQAAGSLVASYGYDFSSDIYQESLNMQSNGSLWDNFLWDIGSWGSQSDVVRHIFAKGRGINCQVSFANKVAGQTFKIHGFNIQTKKSGQKAFQVV